MQFLGISKEFSLYGEEQYDTIGAFWDETAEKYGLENLHGLGHKWENGKIFYAIGLKNGVIDGANFSLSLPECGWTTVEGKTDELKQIYNEIYKNGRLKYEIEEFFEDGSCQIRYLR